MFECRSGVLSREMSISSPGCSSIRSSGMLTFTHFLVSQGSNVSGQVDSSELVTLSVIENDDG